MLALNRVFNEFHGFQTRVCDRLDWLHVYSQASTVLIKSHIKKVLRLKEWDKLSFIGVYELHIVGRYTE